MQTAYEFYDQNGYFVASNAIAPEKIDRIVSEYQNSILNSHDRFLRQSTNRWEQNRHNEYGACIQSFLNIHHFPKYPLFSKAALEIFCSTEMQNLLKDVTGEPNHSVVQTMLFDQNTATAAHQDWYYLDSQPSGLLHGAWIALEDIYEDAGRFFVIPGTHKIDFQLSEDEKHSNPLYIKLLGKYFSDNLPRVVAPALKKGDVLIWNSGTVHGSLGTKNPKLSRKSLTAHYVKDGLPVGRKYDTSFSPAKYAVYNGVQYRLVEENEFSTALNLKNYAFRYLWNHPKLMRTIKWVQSLAKTD